MADTVEQITLDVQAFCPDADPNLARLWVRDAARRIMEARQWSWLLRRGQFVIPASVNNVSTGATVSATQDSDELTFSSGVAAEAWVGRQFRTATSSAVYDIIGYVSATKVKIFPAWGAASVSGSGWTIQQMRLTLPADCQALISVISPQHRWQLWLDVPQETLDSCDPARSSGGGVPNLLSPLDYSTVPSGSVAATELAGGGVNPKPISGGVYTGLDDAVFVLQVTTGGVGGTAVFKWCKNSGAYNTGITSNASDGNYLSDGVSVVWPDTSTFVLNDVFVIRTKALLTPGVPRMEIYPYPSSAMVLPYLYITRHPDITEPGVSIPGILGNRGDVIREKALEMASAWPGTEDRPNTYNQINRRDYHGANANYLMSELARQDNMLFQRNVLPVRRLPYAPWPFGGIRDLQTTDDWSLYLNV